MKFSNKSLENIAYGLLTALVLIIIFKCINYNSRILEQVNFRGKTNMNSNVVEGFGGRNERKYKKDESVYELVERKLDGLSRELGGSQGKKETKQILANTKKICSLECAKCMMNMIEENKGIKSIDLERMLDDEDSENCIKCKKYTELSQSIQSIIDNL